MQVQNHRLRGIPYIESPNRSGFMTPTVALMHYTAGYTARSAIATLTNRRRKASAHLVIDTDGSITQLVPFNRVAWHAGRSSFMGRRGVNNFSIGFEFVNPGFFKEVNGGYQDAYGTRLSDRRLSQFQLTNRGPVSRLGSGTFVWPAYTDAQINAGLAAFDAIVDAYPSIRHVTGHEDVDLRGWKSDPGPAFPMGEFEDVLLYDSGPMRDTDRADGLEPVRERRTVDVGRLNVRDKPSIRGRILTTLSGGSEVIILEDTGKWSRVEYAPGLEGWLADGYLA
jgi:N-acetylmuramoyl-L-alanine amidase